ncbi:MAG: RNA methyltransferase [Bacteroidota bacterium]
MISKNEIKFIKALSLKKFRVQHRKFIAEGSKIVLDLLNSSIAVSTIYALDEWILINRMLAQKAKTLVSISPEELKKISTLTTPNQVLAVAEIPQTKFNPQLASKSIIIALDNIRDPGNLGTIIRIADWFGHTSVVCSETCVDAYNSKTIQASMGSIGRIDIFYLDLKSMIQNTSVPAYGAFLEGKSVYDEAFENRGFLVIGNEANGISPDIAKLITHKIVIPAGNLLGIHAESLNASIATAIICSEVNRQLLNKKISQE